MAVNKLLNKKERQKLAYYLGGAGGLLSYATEVLRKSESLEGRDALIEVSELIEEVSEILETRVYAHHPELNPFIQDFQK